MTKFSSKAVRPFTRVMLAASAVSLLAGCLHAEAERDLETYQARAEPLMKQAPSPRPTKDIGYVVEEQGSWLGGTSFRASYGDPLPSVGTMTIVSAVPMTLQDLAARITRDTGIPTYVDNSSEQDYSGNSGAGGPNAMPVPPPMGGGSSDMMDMMAMQSGEAHQVNYSGTLRGLLDLVSSRWGVEFEYKNGEIRLYRFVTRTFAFELLPGEASLSTTMAMATGGDGDSGGEGGGSGGATAAIAQQTGMKFEMNAWDEIEEGIKSILPETARYSLSPATGSITVTAPVWAMKRVEQYIENQNAIMRRMVTVNVNIYTVSLDESDEYGVDLSGVFDGIDELGLSVAAPPAAIASGAGAITGRILSGSFSDTEAVVRALSTRGRVGMYDEGSVTVMNNSVGPLNMLRQTSYVREVGTTVTDGVSQVSRTPGTITTGVSLAFLPRVFEDGRVLLNSSIQIAALRGITQSGGSDNSIQLPDIDTRGFLQSVTMKSGETLVLTGMGRYEARRDESGMGSTNLWVLGGNNNGGRNRTMLVITLTPNVLSTSREVALR